MFYLWFDRVVLSELIIGQASPAKKDWLTERSEYLSSLMGHPLNTGGDRESIRVLHTYREGCLQRPASGKAVIFVGGIQRTGEVEFDNFEWKQVIEWNQDLKGRGGLHIEKA